MDFTNLKAIAEKLSDTYKANALALIERMEEVVEGIGDEPVKWKPSNLKLMQGTTDRSSAPRDARIGDFILGENTVGRPLKFIPIRIWDGRQMWSPDPNESKLLCSSPDAKVGYIGMQCSQCPHAVFDEVAKKSECGRTKNAIAITSDLSDIFIIGFAKTNYKTGSDLVTAAKKAGVTLYRRVYGLSSETNKNYKNVENFTLEKLSDTERVTSPEILDFLKELFDLIGDDRKESIDAFYKSVEARRKDTPQLLASPGAGDANTILLTSDAPADEVSVSPLAKSYDV